LDFEEFPEKARERLLDALTVATEGDMPGIAKPLLRLGSGIFELACGLGAMRTGSFTACSLVPTFG
jgi:hypothetical protein